MPNDNPGTGEVIWGHSVYDGTMTSSTKTAADIQAAVDPDPVPAVPPLRFMGRTEVARYLGLAGLGSLTGVNLPPPDAMIDDRLGWTEGTIDAWKLTRPGRGRWGPRDEAN